MPVTVQEQRTRVSPCAQGAPSAAGGERARAVSTEGGARGPGGVGLCEATAHYPGKSRVMASLPQGRELPEVHPNSPYKQGSSRTSVSFEEER